MPNLNIVAHPDDDLLFLQPDMGDDDIVLYMTYGDDGRTQPWQVKVNAIEHTYPHTVGQIWYGLKSNSLKHDDPYGQIYQMYHHPDTEVLDYWLKPTSGHQHIEMLRTFIELTNPDVVRTHDPDCEPAILEGGDSLDHIDHIYTAKFVVEALRKYQDIPLFVYTGYPMRFQPENLYPEQIVKKTNLWRRYQEIDTSVAGEIWDVALSRCYNRQYEWKS